MRVLLIYHSRTGTTHKLMQALGAEFGARNHHVTYIRLEAEKPLSYLGAGWAALRRREAKLKTDLPKSLMPYDLVIVAGPVHAGRTSAELNTFINGMPDAVGRRVAVFATMGGNGADNQLKYIKVGVERAGGLIIYEDAIRRDALGTPQNANKIARDIVEQVLRPSVW